jgi:hypothetical protein
MGHAARSMSMSNLPAKFMILELGGQIHQVIIDLKKLDIGYSIEYRFLGKA